MSDVEIIPAAGAAAGAEIETLPSPPQPMNLFGADSPAEVVERATEHAKVLKDILVNRGHIVRIGGGEHVKLEGWTTLGSQVGVFPVVVRTEKLDDGYMAFAEARTLAGAVVGAAEAVCLRSERNWKSRDDYALLSMAQTRACSKALRMPLGFIIELAGYNPTPAEEMTFAQDSDAGPTAHTRTASDERGSSAPTSSGGAPPLPPLAMSEDDRLEDGSFPAECPYCRTDLVEEERRIKKGTPDERDQKFTNCTNPQCGGGQPRTGRDGGRWPWSCFGSLEGTIKAGGRLDELVNGGHGVVVENITPEFDPKAYFHRVFAPITEWDEKTIQSMITQAKKEVAHRAKWSQEVCQKVALLVLDRYYAEYPTDESRPF